MNARARLAGGRLFLGLLTMAGCDSGGTDRGTVPAVYTDVQQIFDMRCAGGSCHVGVQNPALLGGGLDLSAAQAAPCLIGKPSSQVSTWQRVQPGAPAQSYLMCKLDPTCSAQVGSPMPIGAPLTTAELDALRSWIAAGATGGATGACLSDPVTSDQQAPTFAGVTSAMPAPSSITLGWAAASDNVTPAGEISYLIYQTSQRGAQNFASPTYTTLPGVTSYAIGMLPINTQLFFVVRARDAAGNIDANKTELSATTPAMADVQPPTFAGLGSATAASLDITLSWAAGSDVVTPAGQLTYLIYQATATGGQVFTTPTYTTTAGATSFVARALNPNTTYFFVVRARDAAGNIDANKVERSAKTANSSLSSQVQPIFTAACTGGACHGNRNPAQGLDLSSAAASYANLVGVASSQCATTQRVKAGAPDQSYLMWKLQGSGPCFSGSQMPKGQPLSAADQGIIRSWILAGAPNN